ncbi:hypothetical protein JD969_11785 [Planctomycetota bacterium]|nr:hypothetical protein JD969_11785 [Planctomycetota bacterium]
MANDVKTKAIEASEVFLPSGEGVSGVRWDKVMMVNDVEGGMKGVWIGNREAVDVWGVIVFYWPEWFSVVAVLLCAVMLVWWWRRRKLREVKAGEAYCRKCGYWRVLCVLSVVRGM